MKRHSYRPHRFGDFFLRRSLGFGAFGEVWIGTRIEDDLPCVIKRTTNPLARLSFENEMLQRLQHLEGVPRVYQYGTIGVYEVLAMERLGPEVEQLLIKKRKTEFVTGFSVSAVAEIALQLFVVLEEIHKCGCVHRDMKPENLLLGRGEESRRVHLIDFGLAKKVSKQNRTDSRIVGTTEFLSQNAHLGNEQSARDDLESLGYVLLHLLRPLPWDRIFGTEKERVRRIEGIKRSTPLKELCEGAPAELLEYMRYVRGMKFRQKPKYKKIRALFEKILSRHPLSNKHRGYGWLFSESVGSTSGSDLSKIREEIATSSASASEEEEVDPLTTPKYLIPPDRSTYRMRGHARRLSVNESFGETPEDTVVVVDDAEILELQLRTPPPPPIISPLLTDCNDSTLLHLLPASTDRERITPSPMRAVTPAHARMLRRGGTVWGEGHCAQCFLRAVFGERDEIFANVPISSNTDCEE